MGLLLTLGGWDVSRRGEGRKNGREREGGKGDESTFLHITTVRLRLKAMALFQILFNI